MAISNADLAEKISTLIDFWSQLTVEYKSRLGGSVGGGPSADGKYPRTNVTGDAVLVECPARLSDDGGGFVDQVETSATEAAASATAALASEDEALVQKGLAVDARVLAQTARTEAETAESSAVDAKTTAITQANLATDRAGYAEEWANLEFETLVSAAAGGDQTDDYSALHWSVVAAGFAGNIDSGLYGQLAQNETVPGLWAFTNAAGITVEGAAITDTLIGNWNTAFGWGNHASPGYAAGSHDHVIADITDANDGNWDTAFGWEASLNLGLTTKSILTITTGNWAKPMGVSQMVSASSTV